MDRISNSSKAKLEQKDSFFNGKRLEQYNKHTEHLLGTFVGDDERGTILENERGQDRHGIGPRSCCSYGGWATGEYTCRLSLF